MYCRGHFLEVDINIEVLSSFQTEYLIVLCDIKKESFC